MKFINLESFFPQTDKTSFYAFIYKSEVDNAYHPLICDPELIHLTKYNGILQQAAQQHLAFSNVASKESNQFIDELVEKLNEYPSISTRSIVEAMLFKAIFTHTP